MYSRYSETACSSDFHSSTFVAVPIQSLLEQVASLKRSQPGAAELSAAVDTLRQRNEQLLQLLQLSGLQLCVH